MDIEGLPSGAGPCSRLYLRITSLCASGLLVSAGSFSPSLSSSKLPPPPASAPQPWGCDCTRRRAPGSSSAMQNTNVGGPSTRQHTHTHTHWDGPPSALSLEAPSSSAALPIPRGASVSSAQVRAGDTTLWLEKKPRYMVCTHLPSGLGALPPGIPDTGQWPKPWAREWRAAGTG